MRMNISNFWNIAEGRKMRISLFIFDVDGTLTDGGIYYDNSGNEFKKFNVNDAAAFFVLKKLGYKTMVLTGRECEATKRRMEELGVDFFFQNVVDKASFLNQFIEKQSLSYLAIGYVGDDLNDYSAMKKCGYKACPSDACKEIKEIADYISSNNGGKGAVRQIVEHYLEEEGQWKEGSDKVYHLTDM